MLIVFVAVGTIAVALALSDSPRALWWRVLVLVGFVVWEALVMAVSVWVYDNWAERGAHRR